MLFYLSIWLSIGISIYLFTPSISPLSLSLSSHTHPHSHAHTHTHTYIYIYMKWILLKGLTIGTAVFSWIVLKKPIMISLSCSRRLLTRQSLLRLELFFTGELVCYNPWTVFLPQTRSGKLMFNPFVNIFGLKHASRYTIHIRL